MSDAEPSPTRSLETLEPIQRFTDRRSFLDWLEPAWEHVPGMDEAPRGLWYWFDFRGWVLHACVRPMDRPPAGYRMAEIPASKRQAIEFYLRTVEAYSTVYLVSERARHRLCVAIRYGLWMTFPDEYLGWPKSDLREIDDEQMRGFMDSGVFSEVLEEVQEFGVSVRLLPVASNAKPRPLQSSRLEAQQ